MSTSSPFKSILAAVASDETPAEKTKADQTKPKTPTKARSAKPKRPATAKKSPAKPAPQRTPRVVAKAAPQTPPAAEALTATPTKKRVGGRKGNPDYAQLTTYIPALQRRTLRARAIEQELQVSQVIEGLVTGWLGGEFVLENLDES